MSNSVTGSYQTTPERSMSAFDKLPPTARRALANSIECWAVQPILTHHRRGTKGFVTGGDIALRVAKWDADELRKRENQSRRAIGPYKGNMSTIAREPARPARRA